MKINHRHIILIIFALACIGVSSAGYFLIYKQTIAQADHYINANKQLDNEDSKKQSDQNLNKLYESTQDSRAKLTDYLVKEDKIVGLIEMIENVGVQEKTDVQLSSISNNHDVVRAKVAVKGSWSDTMATLTMIENLPLSISLANVNLNAIGGIGKEPHGWALSFDIEALMVK